MKTWTRDETKATLPPGPWQDEPDKAVWVDEATGLDCMIHRGPSGALCGYVGVAPGHPWHGKDYGQCVSGCGEDWCDHRPDGIARVHGGLTYAAPCQTGEDVSDDHGICHVPSPGRPHNVWWFGFDCAHSGDLCPKYHHLLPSHLRSRAEAYRNFAYVQREVAGLAAQLKENA